MEKPKFEPGKLFRLIKEAQPPKGRIGFAFLIGILETVAGLLVPLLTMQMINSFSEEGLSYSLISIAAVALLGQAILSGFAFYLMTSIGERIVASIRRSHVLKLRMPYFDEPDYTGYQCREGADHPATH